MSTPGLSNIHSSIVDDVPQLRRGTVWCYTCGKTQQVDSAKCLRSGWPLCCGQTMSIDSPTEVQNNLDKAREALKLNLREITWGQWKFIVELALPNQTPEEYELLWQRFSKKCGVALY